jgi:hypothetical protein
MLKYNSLLNFLIYVCEIADVHDYFTDCLFATPSFFKACCSHKIGYYPLNNIKTVEVEVEIVHLLSEHHRGYCASCDEAMIFQVVFDGWMNFANGAEVITQCRFNIVCFHY